MRHRTAAAALTCLAVSACVNDDGTGLSNSFVPAACRAVHDTPRPGADREAILIWRQKNLEAVRVLAQQQSAPGARLSPADQVFVSDFTDYVSATFHLGPDGPELEPVPAPITPAMVTRCQEEGVNLTARPSDR